MESQFNDALDNIYARQTRLTSVRANGDLQLEGEIYDYSLTPLAIGSDAYSSETRLNMVVKVTFINNNNPDESFSNRSFSSNLTFPITSPLTVVHLQLVTDLIEEMVEAFLNPTSATW